jgi:hypothetical protein
MAFAQQSGPPASRRQVEQIQQLVRAAGHADLRGARGPLQLNQRQAGGRFTSDEANALIARLEAEAESASGTNAAAPAVSADADQPARPVAARVPAPARDHPAGSASAAINASLRKIPSPLLAAELQRRGWIVVEP